MEERGCGEIFIRPGNGTCGIAAILKKKPFTTKIVKG